MSLKPQNLIQAAEADLKRRLRNTEAVATTYERYAFHRMHVRRARSAHDLLRLALMSPPMKFDPEEGTVELTSTKPNTKLIYGNAGLLVAALKLLGDPDDADPDGDREHAAPQGAVEEYADPG
jgi:hypothetical protein